MHNQFYLFVNKVDNSNRVVDTCWDDACGANVELHFSMTQIADSVNVSHIIVGNSGAPATIPAMAVLRLKPASDFKLGVIINKNINCKIAENSFYQPINAINGNCALQCARGYYADKETNRCIHCDAKCAHCEQAFACKECHPGYAVVDGQCLPCIEPCKNCSTSQTICTSCIVDAMYDNSANNCQKLCKGASERNCLSCDFRTGNCLMCKPGFNLVNDQCSKQDCQIANCVTCLSSSACQICAVGYQSSSGSCSVCSQNCTICPPGYELSPAKSCIGILNKEYQAAKQETTNTNQITNTNTNTNKDTNTNTNTNIDTSTSTSTTTDRTTDQTTSYANVISVVSLLLALLVWN